MLYAPRNRIADNDIIPQLGGSLTSKCGILLLLIIIIVVVVVVVIINDNIIIIININITGVKISRERMVT